MEIKMKKCNLKLINQYFDNQIDSIKKTEIKNHINKCNQCKKYYNELKKLNELMLKNVDNPNVNKDFALNVMNQVESKQPKKTNKILDFILTHPMKIAAVWILILLAVTITSINVLQNKLSNNIRFNYKITNLETFKVSPQYSLSAAYYMNKSN
jgi:predicted anti-sigma-YlaC factor YlaD